MMKNWTTYGLLGVLMLAFIAINIIASATIRSARVDLTDGRLYTLSDGSKAISRLPKEPVRLTLYCSDKQADDVPGIRPYINRVREVLGEYERASGGQVELRIVNPEPFSEAEDAAAQAGLLGQPTGRGNERFYFGLVGANSIDQQQVVPFFDPRRENFLEYDLSRMIYLLSDQPRKPIGLISWINLEGTPPNQMMQTRGTPGWQIETQLRELFDVRPLATDLTEIPADIKALVVVHPKAISDQTQYAIDQFVLRGGRLLMFVDPFCESDLPPGINPMQAMGLPRSSDAPKLLNALGLELLNGRVAVDKSSGIRVSVGSAGRPEALDYIAWLQLTDKNRNATDPVTGQLGTMIMATAGVLAKKDGSAAEIVPLLHTTPNSSTIDAASVQVMPDPKKLLADFVSGNKQLTLAARIGGRVKSAFPNGFPPLHPADPNVPEAERPKPPTASHIAESAEPINAIVIADCDMLADRFWVQRQQVAGIDLGLQKISDNGDFVVGALDNLTGSSDLMSLRARGKFARPFDRVEQLRKDADQAYLAKEQALQAKLRETEAKIGDIQRKRPDGNAATILTPEQAGEIEKFRAEMADTRRELREVQHGLRKDIESLGTRIKAINIGLMPVLIGLGALGLAAYRASRRNADRRTGSRT